jgi:hypothetical protein
MKFEPSTRKRWSPGLSWELSFVMAGTIGLRAGMVYCASSSARKKLSGGNR